MFKSCTGKLWQDVANSTKWVGGYYNKVQVEQIIKRDGVHAPACKSLNWLWPCWEVLGYEWIYCAAQRWTEAKDEVSRDQDTDYFTIQESRQSHLFLAQRIKIRFYYCIIIQQCYWDDNYIGKYNEWIWMQAPKSTNQRHFSNISVAPVKLFLRLFLSVKNT